MRTAVRKPLVDGTSVPPAYRSMSGVEAMATSGVPLSPCMAPQPRASGSTVAAEKASSALVGSTVTGPPTTATAPRIRAHEATSPRFRLVSTATVTEGASTAAPPAPAAGGAGRCTSRYAAISAYVRLAAICVGARQGGGGGGGVKGACQPRHP
jgi:hypothetical protein